MACPCSDVPGGASEEFIDELGTILGSDRRRILRHLSHSVHSDVECRLFGGHRRPTVVGGHGGSLTPRCLATCTISLRDCVATHCGVTIHIVLLSTCPKQQQWFNLGRLRFNRRGTSTPLKGVESCSLPSGWPNPIPAIPPYVVTTPHLHGAPTTEETSYPNAKARSGINMEKRTKINTFFKKKKKRTLWIMKKKE